MQNFVILGVHFLILMPTVVILIIVLLNVDRLSAVILGVIMLSIIMNVKYRYDQCCCSERHSEHRYADRHNDDRRYAERHYSECC